MATLQSAFGTSHSPMLLTSPELWLQRADQDRTNPELNDHQGRNRTWDDLDAEAGDQHRHQLTPEVWEERFTACHKAMDRLAVDLAALQPDVLVIVGDDQSEVFDASNQPVMGVFWGDQWQTDTMHNAPPGEFFETVASGYAMAEVYRFAGEPQLGRDLVGSLVRSGFDVASLAATPAGRGFGHAYGFIIRRLLGDRAVPVVPILLNTYYPPNQPPAARCYDFGVALARAIEESDYEGNVVLGASGGLSHFVIDEDLDRKLLQALHDSDAATLKGIPDAVLNAGSSEIRNWITVGGAMHGREVAWSEYAPCYRTAAGTGCGMAFARWH
jgi:hypothetical protein